MATSKILIPEFDGTPKQIAFGDFDTDLISPAEDLRHLTVADTEVQIDLTALADNAARQSAKFDFGAVRSPVYARCAFEFDATPTAGEVVELYVGYSQHATAATANPGNLSGSDAAYTGYSSNLDDSLKHLDYIGEFVCTVQATANIQVGRGSSIFVPKQRYGVLVVYNKSGAAFVSDASESHLVFDPVFYQGQAT